MRRCGRLAAPTHWRPRWGRHWGRRLKLWQGSRAAARHRWREPAPWRPGCRRRVPPHGAPWAQRPRARGAPRAEAAAPTPPAAAPRRSAAPAPPASASSPAPALPPNTRPPSLCAQSALNLEPLRAPRTRPLRAPRGPEAVAGLCPRPGAGAAPVTWSWAEEASRSLPRDALRAQVYPTPAGTHPHAHPLLLWSQKDLDVNSSSFPCTNQQ